ncbi:hypothetical protein NDU88_001022 [Pleurodeles waltl]|uniref:Uncharacterized protein n=1 Tax=Pleurodeles waltl TaxID=8319 RepID=A0AAV7U5R6_PLEWA|nr:hypothetical protein NDU88_001022 [Pleurodeles waltl]
MPPSKASAAKRKGRDPELSQLLKMVLEKFGNDDTDSSDRASDNEVGGDCSSRPRRAHVAPRAAFPPVKRRKNGKTAAPAPPNQAASAVVSPPVVVAPSVIPVPGVATPPTLQGLSVDTAVAPPLGIEEVLANIRKSLAALSPAGQSGPPPTTLPVVPPPAAPPLSPAPQAPVQQVQGQDSHRQALLEVSRLLASMNGPANSTPPPTTPWVANNSLQNSLLELKRQVDGFAAGRSSNTSQASSNSRVSPRHRAL